MMKTRRIGIPSLAAVEADLSRRGLSAEKASPAADEVELPTVVAATTRLESTLRRVLTTAWKQVRTAVPEKVLEQAVMSRHIVSVFSQYVTPAIQDALTPGVMSVLRASFLRGARVGAEGLAPLGVRLRAAPTISIAFDLINDLAVRWAATHAGRLITEVTAGQQEMAARVVAQALEQGRTVDQVARDLRTFIGLRADQAEAVLNFRGTLIDQEVAAATIERRATRYAQSLLNQRNLTIARTEVVSSANAGQLGLWDQAASQGLFDKEQTEKVWIATEDELLCPICEPLAGEAVGLDETFETEDGQRLEGPTAHPNCRCGLNLKFNQ